jgi:hypothetical protein
VIHLTGWVRQSHGCLLGSNFGQRPGAVTALLFYFGYVSTRAKYEYFGVDVDVVGLGTRDFLMRYRDLRLLLEPSAWLGFALV